MPAADPRNGQRWWIAAAAAAVAVVVATVTVVAMASDTGGSQTTASRGVSVPVPPVKSSPAPETHSPAPPPPTVSLVEDSALPTLVPDIATVSPGERRRADVETPGSTGSWAWTMSKPPCPTARATLALAATGKHTQLRAGQGIPSDGVIRLEVDRMVDPPALHVATRGGAAVLRQLP